MSDRASLDEGCVDPQLYESPPSLWHYIESCASRHEIPEIKNLLGESLVEQSLELHQEVELLLGIWHDYRQEMLLQPPKPRLPEPPAQRDLLKAEIKFFIDNIHEKAKANGRDPSLILLRHNSHIMDYVIDDKARNSCVSRISTDSSSSSGFGRETSSLRASSRLSTARSDAITLEDIRTKLNGKTVFQFDDVLQHLKDVLESEISDLIEDIAFLQGCLEEEVDMSSQSRLDKEPTLFELREERSNLERELLSPDFVTHPVLRRLSITEDPLSDDDVSLATYFSDDKVASPSIRKRLTDSVSSLTPDKEKTPTPPSVPNRRPVAVKPFPDEAFTVGSQLPRAANLSGNESTIKPRPPSTASTQSMRRLTLQTASPSHVVVRTGKQSAAMTTLPSEATSSMAVGTSHDVRIPSLPSDTVVPDRKPVPPSTTRIASRLRPSTAQRFRNMVLECRDGK